MGIVIEFDPELALRNISEFKAGRRKKEECIPSPLKSGPEYSFLKKGQRNYWIFEEVALVETKGNQELSLPVASIVFLEVTHFLIKGEVYTKGKYKIKEIFDEKDRNKFACGYRVEKFGKDGFRKNKI